ncbi:ATP-grasp domain-containing protein [Bdellovibrio sp. HCB185ZH]|uniref:ATP-grasp domain-containing protein n=1 Tax=Bdellovibrio sp. HCB185ZH TaxID=3394235 RepID=UPI0039A4F9EE
MLNLKILLLSRKFEIHSSRRLVEEGVSRGHTMLLWDPEWPLTRLKIRPDIIIPRISSFQFSKAVKVLTALEKQGCLSVNPSQNYTVARNKWFTYVALTEANIASPSSYLITRFEETIPLEFPVIIKRLESSKGEGVFLAENPRAIADIFLNTGDEELLAQEFFPEAFGTDVRAFVVGGEIKAAMKRTARPGEFRSNLALGATAEPCELEPHESELILKTIRTLGLQVSGVDLLRTRKGSLVLEANPCPGLEGIEKYSQQNLAKSIIQYAEELYGKHKTSR